MERGDELWTGGDTWYMGRIFEELKNKGSNQRSSLEGLINYANGN